MSGAQGEENKSHTGKISSEIRNKVDELDDHCGTWNMRPYVTIVTSAMTFHILQREIKKKYFFISLSNI